MKHIDILDRAAEQNMKISELGVNRTFCAAYFTSLEAGNDAPDFDEVIWDDDIEAIVADCRRFGITEFTVSSTFSSLIPALERFTELGCRMEGLTKVRARYTDWRTGEKEIRPAIKMSL